MTTFGFWLASLAGLCIAFLVLPEVRFIIALLTVPYALVFVWGIFDLRSNFFLRAFIRNKEEPRAVGLTFDDGPDENLTPDILDLLKRFNFHATFFVVATSGQAHPDILKRMIAEGHVVACHDLAHSLMSNFRFFGGLHRDIGAAQAALSGIIGAKPLLYRPPVGLSNPHLGRALARLSLSCVGWSRSARDGGNRRIGGIRRISAIAVRAGDVVLLHDALPKPEYKQEIVHRLDGLFERIKKAGLEPVGINELFDCSAYQMPK